MASLTVAPTKKGFQLTRKRILGIALALIGALMLGFSVPSLDASAVSLLTFAPDGVEGVPQIPVPTQAYALIVGLILLGTGVLAALELEGQARLTNAALVTGGLLLIPTLIIITHAGNRANLVAFLVISLRLATPIAIGAMAGIWCERSGVINIAIEGMMLTGACFGFTVLFYLRTSVPADQFWQIQTVAVAVAVLVGGLVALLHAWLSITFAIDQIISGTVINILAVGVTSFIRREYLASTQAGIERLPSLGIPVLKDIPIIGEAFFVNQPIFFMMFVIIIGTHVMLFYTRWGLRTRAVGEKPSAADTLGIRVNRVRWTNVFIGGLIAGLAGAWFSLEQTGSFSDGMTNGRGFIALAAMIFGKWTPFGAFAGALLFGFSDMLGDRFQVIGVPVPYQFLQMVPYVLTMVVVAGLVGRAVAPKAIGTAYKKE
jgi:simple sugar transport system permease protein